jgi:hypothetical protein
VLDVLGQMTRFSG